MAKKKIFIGVGHGGSDPGAVSGGWKEKDLNLDIAWALYNELERHGVDAMLSRVGDEDDTLEEEIRECNEYAPDLAVDVHNNAGGGDGIETFYHHGGGIGKTFAENIIAEAVKIGQNSRGAKTRKNDAGRDWYGFIRETAAPAVIVECAFVDNPTDMKIIDTAEEREAMGIAIAKAALATLGLPYFEKKPEPEPIPEPELEPEEKEETPAEPQETPSDETLPEPTEDKGAETTEQKKHGIVEAIIAFLEWLLSFLKGETK